MFLEDEIMRGEWYLEKLTFEEKWVCALTPMICEPFFSIHGVVAALVVGPSNANISMPKAPVMVPRDTVPLNEEQE